MPGKSSLWSAGWPIPTCATVAALLACLFLAVACDSSPTAPGPTTPTLVAEASPQVGASATETETLSDLLTAVPDLPTSTPAPAATGINAQDRLNIYLAVIADLLGDKVPPYVYISPYTGSGERLDEPDLSQPIPAQIIDALAKTQPGTKYDMLDFIRAIGPLEDGGVVKNNGAFITLGAIGNDGSTGDTVIIRGSIYRKEGDAVGRRYRLKRDTSATYGWKLLDTTQEWSE